VKTIEEHLRKVVSAHQRDWDERLPAGLPSINSRDHRRDACYMVFGREFRLPSDTKFEAPPAREQSTVYRLQSTVYRLQSTNYAAELVERLYDIHHFARQRLKVVNNRTKGTLLPADQLGWFSRGRPSVDIPPYRKKEKSSKLQTCWEGQYIITTQIKVI
jgi:hypothetical protein